MSVNSSQISEKSQKEDTNCISEKNEVSKRKQESDHSLNEKDLKTIVVFSDEKKIKRHYCLYCGEPNTYIYRYRIL